MTANRNQMHTACCFKDKRQHGRFGYGPEKAPAKAAGACVRSAAWLRLERILEVSGKGFLNVLYLGR